MAPALTEIISVPTRKLQGRCVDVAVKVAELCDLPGWMQKDVYITRGYRPEKNSFRGCYDSLWYLHNQTVNVWSHLLTGIFILLLFLWSSLPVLHGEYVFSAGDLWALQSYLLGAIACLFFSVSSIHTHVEPY